MAAESPTKVLAKTPAKSPPTSLDGRWATLRSHKRIPAKVNLVVEWEQDRTPQSIKAFTLDVSHSGCLAVVGAELQILQNVRLINPQSGRSAQARLVWRDLRTQSAGFELFKPDATFWNL